MRCLPSVLMLQWPTFNQPMVPCLNRSRLSCWSTGKMSVR